MPMSAAAYAIPAPLAADPMVELTSLSATASKLGIGHSTPALPGPGAVQPVTLSGPWVSRSTPPTPAAVPCAVRSVDAAVVERADGSDT